MRCGCGGSVSGRRLPLGAGGSAFFDEDDSRKFLFSRAEGRFLRGSDVLAELEHLDPPVVRVANIEAVGAIDPQAGGRIKLSNFHAGSTKRTELAAVAAVNSDVRVPSTAHIDIACQVHAEPYPVGDGLAWPGGNRELAASTTTSSLFPTAISVGSSRSIGMVSPLTFPRAWGRGRPTRFRMLPSRSSTNRRWRGGSRRNRRPLSRSMAIAVGE